jgi:hypothetical protein
MVEVFPKGNSGSYRNESSAVRQRPDASRWLVISNPPGKPGSQLGLSRAQSKCHLDMSNLLLFKFTASKL